MSSTLQGTKYFPSKGLYLNSPAHVVPMDMASDGFDFIISNGTELSKRDGYSRVNAVPISASAACLGLHSLYLSNGTNQELILGSSGTVYIEAGGAVSASAVGGVFITEPVDYAQYLDTGVFVNGSSNPITWNGTISGNVSAAPSAAISCANHLNKLFLAIKGTSRFHYCATGAIHTWTGVGTDIINVDQNNGQNIVGLKSFARNELIIFKDNSMYKLVGETATNFTLIKVDDSIGCTCVKSIKTYRSTTGGSIMLWAYRDGIYIYDGTTPKKISSYIQTFWDTINRTRHKWMDATIDNDNGRYLLSVSTGSNAVNTRIIAVDLSLPWTDDDGLHLPMFIWRVSAYSMNTEINATTNLQRIVFGEALGRKSYFSKTIYSDNGNGITTEFVSPLMPFEGSLGIENCLRRMYGTYKTTGGGIDVYYNNEDNESFIFVDTIPLESATPSTSIGIDFAIGTSAIGASSGTNFTRTNMTARGERIKIKLSNTSATTGLVVYSPLEFYFKSGGMRA